MGRDIVNNVKGEYKSIESESEDEEAPGQQQNMSDGSALNYVECLLDYLETQVDSLEFMLCRLHSCIKRKNLVQKKNKRYWPIISHEF